ncbi:MAG: sulfatase-like hydrolase/transferase [Nocardioides sp.]
MAAGSLALGGTAAVFSGQADQAAAAAVTAQVRTLRASTRPNLLVITADDMRADDLRWMPRTRHLLADRGLSFRNSFATTPLCAPSRASFLTARYTHNHQVLSAWDPYGFAVFDDSSTLATRLRAAGYRTGLVGKYINGYGEMPTFGDHHSSVRYVPPGWAQWWGSCDRKWSPGQWPGGYTYDYMHLTSNVNGRIHTWPGQYTTDVTSHQTQHLIRAFGKASPTKPWFLWWTPVAPHAGPPREPDDPGTVNRSDGVPVHYSTPARPAWVKHRFDAVLTHGAGTPPVQDPEADVSDKPLYIRQIPLMTGVERRAERDVTRQRAEALYVLDVRIGDTLKALADSGQAARTIVVITSDNGYYLGEHRKRKFKITLHEPSIRVPLIMAGPGIPHGVRYDPVTVEDLAATLAGWAGTTLRNADGHSLRGTIANGDQGWTRPVVLEAQMLESEYANGTVDLDTMRGLTTGGLRTGRYAMIRYTTGETELYDLATDPLELDSLNGPQYDELRQLLLDTWRHYAGCSGSQCQAPLPASLQTGPAANREITVDQDQARHSYYQY